LTGIEYLRIAARRIIEICRDIIPGSFVSEKMADAEMLVDGFIRSIHFDISG